MRGSPSIISILMRSGTVGSEAQRRLVREQADYIFEPPLVDVGLRDWRSFDRAIAEGYAHARMRIEEKGLPLSEAASEQLPANRNRGLPSPHARPEAHSLVPEWDRGLPSPQ
jgi:NTE family protein